MVHYSKVIKCPWFTHTWLMVILLELLLLATVIDFIKDPGLEAEKAN